MKYLITGASGFIGWHLAGRLAGMKHSVTGWSRDAVDVTDADRVAREIARLKPDVIFHFAAQSFPKLSWESPQTTLATNILGTTNILEALAKEGSQCRLLIAGSSSQYKTSRTPIAETAEQEPRDPYALSKFCADKLAVIYGNKYQLDIVRFLPFGIIGPGKTGDVASDFAHKIVHAQRNNLSTIEVGNVDVTRDFLDIEDGLNALLLLAEKGQGGEAYNICSGEGVLIRDMLDFYIGLSGANISYKVAPSLERKNEPQGIIGDPSKLKKLGWKKEIDIEKTWEKIYALFLSRNRSSSTGRMLG